MRWKFTRDGNSIYTCLWCFHVRTGTFLLGLISLLLQVAVLALITVAFIRPDVVPAWVSSFIAPHTNLNVDRTHTGAINSNNGIMMSDIDGSAIGNMRGSDMKIDDALEGENDLNIMKVGNNIDPYEVVKSSRSGVDGTEINGIKNEDSIESDLLNSFDPKMPRMHRDSSFPVFVVGEPAELETSTKRSLELNPDDKSLLFVVLIGGIIASVMLMKGVIQGRPGHMMPYMGLQVFDFCISSLTVFTCFSYAPDIKRWIAAQPDSMPLKSFLMTIDSDRLMLALIMMSVLILVVKAYFMAVVASCYKYLCQAQHEAVHGRRRSTDEDMCNPEDAELLLPPKYEDIVDEPNLPLQSEPAPPPYQDA